MTNWDQECRRVNPDLLGPLPIGMSAQLGTPRIPFPTPPPLPTYTNFDRNDDPRLGCITHPFLVPLLSKWYSHFYLVPKLAVLSIHKLWEWPTTDKELALALNCPFPKKLTDSH